LCYQDCIEKWLLRQREGPLCPCCRRDFVIDPFDLQDVVQREGSGGPDDPVMVWGSVEPVD